MRQRVGRGRARKLERIAEAGAQVELYGRGLVIGGGRAGGHLLREVRDARVQPRQLQVNTADFLGVIGQCGAQALRGDRRDEGEGLVTQVDKVMEGIEERAGLVQYQVAAARGLNAARIRRE